MVKTLLQLTCDFVGDHQNIFTLESITALPCHIQEKLLPYLSAHDLFILSTKDPNHLNSKELDHTWNLHVQRRWSRAQIVMNIFHEMGLNERAQLVYLQKYFLEILSYCSINLNTVDCASEEMVNQMVKKLENHQFTHLVIDDANVHQTFFERLIYTFKDHYGISETNNYTHRPLELLDFQACLKSLSADTLIPFERPICGIQKLDLSMTTILDSGFSLLLELLRNDTALRHLKLNGCFLKEDQVVQLLSVLSAKSQIETLGLSGNKVREDEVETELLKFISNNKKLHTLILNYSRLRGQFVDSEEFINVVMSHPNLKELSIKNNHLKDTVCKVLKRVCCSQKPCSLKSLNIGYNWVKGSELVETAQEIVEYRKSHQMAGYVLDFLCLSGNRLHLSDNSQSRLWTVFDGLVKDLEVDRIDYDRPFDEHIAQM